MAHHHHHHHLHHANALPPIVPTENDVLCGRGVNIAHHAGNERFRTLVNAKRDQSLREPNSATEKRQLAEEILRHIKSLEPPGRFLKRESLQGRRSSSRGKNGTGLDLSGTWELVSDREAIKKTCQALRDSCRTDRNGYAVGVQVPPDVAVAGGNAGVKRDAPSSDNGGHNGNAHSDNGGRLSPSVENAASWLKKQKFPTPPGVDGTVGGSDPNGNGAVSIPVPAPMGMSVPAPGVMSMVQIPGAGDVAPVSDTNGQVQQSFASASPLGDMNQPSPDGVPMQHHFQPNGELQQTADAWGAQAVQAAQQHDGLGGVDLGSPGDPGSLNIEEL